MKNVLLSIVFVLGLVGCRGIDFPQISKCTILSDSKCICTDSFGEEKIVSCLGYDAMSNEDYDKVQQFIIDQQRKLIKCEQVQKGSVNLNVNMLEIDGKETE